MSRRLCSLAVVLVCVVAVMAMWPSDAVAQRRVVVGAAVRPAVVVAPIVRPVFGPRFSHPAFYDPFFWGWYGQYPYPPYPGRPYVYAPMGSARLQITPNTAEVYVNGYFAGRVDRFDGFLQRLDLPVGEHELAFYLEGYRTLRHRVLFRPGGTIRIIDTLEPLAPGEPGEPRPAPDTTVRSQPPERGRPAPRSPEPRYAERARGEYGSLSIRVQPADAIILVNGEPWDRPEGESRMVIELPDGPHRLEVRKDGYRPYTTTVRIRRGETSTLNVVLSDERTRIS